MWYRADALWRSLHSCAADPGGAGADSSVGQSLSAALGYFAAALCLLAEPWPPQGEITTLNASSFDFIVVGAGTAGSTLAARLSETGASVLLLEAGGDPPKETIIPGFRDVLKFGRYDWNFTTVDDQYSSQGLRNGSQRQLRGRLLGGTGSVNDMIYSRGSPLDYDEWAALLGERWAWPSVLRYFKKTEHMTDEAIVHDPDLMKYHGTGGEIQVTGTAEPSLTTKIFLDAFEELGFSKVKDMTNSHRIGVGRFSHTIRNGQRDSSLTAILNKVGNRTNLSVLKDTFVTKILIQDHRAIGVRAFSEATDEELTFYVNKEVIVSAGTFNTPKLLMLSGIGPKEHLEELGIAVVKDLPVGDNLQDHTMVLLYVAAERGSCPLTSEASHMELMKYLHDRTGALSKTDSMGTYMTFQSNSTVPEFAVYPTCSPLTEDFSRGCSDVIGLKKEICDAVVAAGGGTDDYELISLALVLLKPKSRGRVRLSSVDPFDDPLIYSGTFNHSGDLNGFPRAMMKVMSLVNTTYFREKAARVVEIPVAGCEGARGGSEYLKCLALALATSAWHAVGTAPMGSVLDSRLSVLGVAGLRVVDASVMPTVPRGNTNAPVVMVAEMAADFIKEKYTLDIK